MPYAKAFDGTRLYFEETGTGAPLLLISGNGANHTMWDDLRDDFAAHYQSITFDHRGTGASDKPVEPPYSTRTFAQDAIAILDHLAISRTHVYGVSMGGYVAQWLAIDSPERVGTLVLGCTGPGGTQTVRRSSEVDALMKRRTADPTGAARALLETVVSPSWLAADPDRSAHLQQRLTAAPPHTMQLHFKAALAHDAWALLPTITAPTLIIHGSEDVLVPTANAELMRQRIPGAEVHIIAGGRHGYIWEVRDEADRAVLEFLKAHPLPA
ncbi:MAG TPA: alpha/beta fold hydrolase [Dehalococcoidia bacterium]|nr:alpha/beta fold hydrolase [Dehalococcoidia bacterium]